ncbi:MAG: type I-U CRISPR-associated protein Cas7 [Gemmatimonadaceae bacterium]|nr:type I-U CRISPR-associated protein Cas7 [Gemmatimonadaceae bacterium]
MTISFPTSSRLLISADLAPVQGNRFQPTGFPALGAATYRLADDTTMLLVESPQSMANRLETVMLEPGSVAPRALFTGLPYVRVLREGAAITSSLVEAHRLNSPYILEGDDKSFRNALIEALGVADETAVDERLLANVVMKYDPSSLIHGLFLAKKDISGGRFRLRRALSSFIEARNVSPVASGGVKNDRVNPSGDTGAGFGNVPFSREEFTAERVTAYFNLDLGQLRAYRLPEAATALLAALAVWKVRTLLDDGLRLRTACDFEVTDIRATRPTSYELPTIAALEQEIRDGIAKCTADGLFATPAVTDVQWSAGGSAKAAKPAKAAKGKSSPDRAEKD